MPNIIQICQLTKIYRFGQTEVRALDGVDLQIGRGELVAITGRSGSGKSTLMNLLGCLDLPTSGQYLLGGEEVSHLPDHRLSAIRNRQIGFVFQGFNLIAGLTALENVELPLVYRKLPSHVRRRMALDALEQVGLSDRLKHRPFQMSGGQQQRVAIARAIAAKPELILADEPTGNLDSACGAGVMTILKELHQNGRTVIIITHDAKMATACERVIEIRDGKIV